MGGRSTEATGLNAGETLIESVKDREEPVRKGNVERSPEAVGGRDIEEEISGDWYSRVVKITGFS